MENQLTPTKSSNSMMWIIIVVIVIILGVGAYYFMSQDDATNTNNANSSVNNNMAVNENTNAAVNENVNENTNVAVNENANTGTNTNATVDMSGWDTYENTSYKFSVNYPDDLIKWETEISEAVRNQRGDSLLLDVGFRPEDLQGSIFLIHIFSKSIEEVTSASQEFGVLTDETIIINGKTATKMSEGTNRYGIDGDEYSYIVEVNNYRNDNDLEIYNKMLDTLIIN